MICTPNLEGIDMDCNNSVGGIDRLMIGLRDTLYYTEDSEGDLVSVHGVFYNIDILENAGTSSFTDVTTNNDGVTVSVPTITAEVLGMTPSVRKAVQGFAQPYAKLVALVRLTNGEWALAGKEFGLSLTAEGASGTQRSEKQRYTLTLVGEENYMADLLDEDQVDAFIVENSSGLEVAEDGHAYMERLIELSKTEYVNIGSFSTTMENLQNAIL